LQRQVMREIVEPTVATLRAEGMPYVGVLYAGLMLTDAGPKLIEYNARFGDPECQVLMMRLDEDLAALLLACAEGRLAEFGQAKMVAETALTVVMAAKGYGAKVFHAGTAMQDSQLVATGGRVLNVTAMAATVTEAQRKAYAAVDAIRFPSGFCRRDIGWREVAREQG
jgi:phosphoribosylamine--glycine ligase